MKRRNVLTLTVLVLVVLCTSMVEASNKPVIGIIQYVEHIALDSARDGFLKALEDNGYGDVEIDYQNAQGDASNLSTISDRFISKKVDLVLAIATPAAQSIAAKTTTIPILGTAITDYVVARLIESNEKPNTNVSGTTDLNPVEEQIKLITELVPNAKTIGVLYTSSEDNSVLQAKLAKDAIKDLGLKYYEVTISNSNEVQQAVQSTVRRVDAIYIPTDNIFASAMPIVHGVAVQSKTPVIPGEVGMALAGGIASLGINYYDLGYETGLMAIEVLEGAKPANLPIRGAARFDYIINGEVAKEISLEIPEKYLEYLVD